jgi:hypothetical protein
MVQPGTGRVVLMALMAGLVGGMAGNRLLATDPVIAQEAAPRAQVITVRKLIVTDKEGNPRAQLAVSDAGEPRLDLVDKGGTSLASLALTAEGGSEFLLNSKDGSPRVRLALLSKGQPRLDFTMEKDGRSVASLGLSSEGWPDLHLSGKEGKAAATMAFLDGNPRILLEDKKGQVSAALMTAPEKAGLILYQDSKPRASVALEGIDLVDAGGQPRAAFHLMEGGQPRLALRDKEGQRLVSLSVEPLPKKELPLLAMYDKKDVLRAGLNLDEEGRANLILRDRPLLSLIDKTGEDGIFLSIERENRPSLLLSSKKGRHSAFFGLRDNKELALDFLDEANTPRASVFLDADGEPSIHLWDKKGKALWSTTKGEPEKAAPLVPEK